MDSDYSGSCPDGSRVTEPHVVVSAAVPASVLATATRHSRSQAANPTVVGLSIMIAPPLGNLVRSHNWAVRRASVPLALLRRPIPRASQHAPRARLGDFAVANDNLTIHDHIL